MLLDLPEKLVARKEGNIGWIVFNNPARHNAVSLEMWQALPRVIDAYVKDPEVRVVILTGAGEKAFMAGADISQFKDKRSDPEAVRIYNETGEAAGESLRGCPKPTIAMIRGYCIGGGTGTAVNCDIRIAADDARFGVTAARLGLGYRYGNIKRLANLVGPAYAAEIYFTARQFSAQEAQQMGLVNRVVPVAELETFTRDYAATICANAPLTIASIKRALIEYLKAPDQPDMELFNTLFDRCFVSADYKEGQRAFMEKRKPVFTGQ